MNNMEACVGGIKEFRLMLEGVDVTVTKRKLAFQ